MNDMIIHMIFQSIPIMATAEYVCSLNEKSVKKAKKELHEDPKQRIGAVETFRTWIQQQKHIRCETGNK